MKQTELQAVEKDKPEMFPAVRPGSPAEMIMSAVKQGTDLAQLEHLLEIQMKWEANEARKVFASSMASTQEKILSVLKTKLNPQTHSKYADLGDVVESSKPVYTADGFSITFYEGETKTPDCIRICADVLHRAGHKETYHMDIPNDGVGIKGNANMTRIHAKASSISYARRYLMCMIWNIPTSEKDGNQASELISKEEKDSLVDSLIAMGGKVDAFLKYMNVATMDDIPKADLPKALAAVEAAKKAKVPTAQSPVKQ